MNKTIHEQIIRGIREICKGRPVVVAVSGGVDSALSLTLTVRALGAGRVTAILLPYGQQDMEDARLISEWNGVRIMERNIESAVAAVEQETGQMDEARRGNVMARVRMIYLYDLAKSTGALVIGTENKSEHYLGYYTRFGDEASDMEPLLGLYKTEVWEMARELKLPKRFVTKAPSAGLWEGQTDEKELGFSYMQADQVLKLWVEEGIEDEGELVNRLREKVEPEVIKRVIRQVKRNAFKLEVPYLLA